MATTNNAYSDLIHLFIDGEATEVERNTLFNALKDSPELQEEFSSAMRLKQAFSADIMQLQPPTYLQSQIAERAGILVAASATAANAPVIVNAVSNAVSNVAPVATGILSKGVITMLVGTSIGVLSTIGIIKLTSNNDAKNLSPVVPQLVIRQAEPAHTPQSLILPAEVAPMEMTKGSFMSRNSGTDFSPSLRNERTKVRSTGTQISENQTPTVDNHQNIENSTPVENPKPSEIPDNQPSTIDNRQDIGMINAVAPRTPIVKAIGDNGHEHSPFSSGNLPDMGPSFDGRLSARLTGIAASKLYQGNDMAFSSSKNFDWAGAIKYDVDPSNAFGVEAGHEKFPLYLANGNGGYDDYRSISWAGISWTYSAVYLDLPLGIHPELRAVVAESTAGPIIKGSFGAVLPLTPRLSFAVDGEETMLPIRSNGTNLIGNKFALSGSLIFHF